MRYAGGAMASLFGDMGGPDFTQMQGMGQKAKSDQRNMAMKSDFMVDKAHS